MLIRGRKTKSNKTKPPLRFERDAQPGDEVSGDRYVWYRYKLIRERLAPETPTKEAGETRVDGLKGVLLNLR
jgi:hypothetical protein